jgi:hypothetical protein
MTDTEIIAAVDAILKSLDRKNFPNEAVNWARVRCAEAREFKSGGWLVIVYKAAPEAWRLAREVEKQLLEKHQITADVSTEW